VLALFPNGNYALVMKVLPGKSVVSLFLASVLAGVLVLLAVLQFHWINKVAQAEQDRMETSLETDIVRFRWDFYSQLLHVCSAFQVEPDNLSTKALRSYADRYEDWTFASTRPRLVAGLWVWKAQNNSGTRLFRLNPVSEKLERASWPPEFGPLRAAFQRDPATFFRFAGPLGARRHWNLVEQVPALVRVSWGPPMPGRPSPQGYVIIALDMKYLRSSLLPLLTERYFRGPRGLVYRVSIVSRSSPRNSIYESGGNTKSGYPPDAVVDVIPLQFASLLQSPLPDRLIAGSRVNLASGFLPSFARPGLGKTPSPIIVLAGQKPDWQMIVRHRSGSLQAAVVELRRRDLAVSFAVLVVLAVGMALIVISAQRAQRLARSQMDFVAGVSHELRTPLAVICSAAENLADGVIAAQDQIREYGALIKTEGRHLTEMVEQTLGFAAQQTGRPETVVPVEIAGVIDAALMQAGLVIGSSDIHLEKQIQPDLPTVVADPSALIRCLQNLLVNAVKYGGENVWVRISARAVRGKKKREVEIVVADKGIGIAPRDLPHIFEPFYRGQSRQVAQIRGTGLGLSLARDIVEAMGGTLSVKSELGKGTSFTLRLPALTVVENVALTEPFAANRTGDKIGDEQIRV
jgi:signal transduction histidine kinase